MPEIADDFVHSLKTKRRFNSQAKCTVWVSTKSTSLLLVRLYRTKNVTVITSTHNLLLSSIKSCSFFVVKNKQTRLRFLVLEKLPPEKPRDIAFNPISPYEVSILYASVHVCFALWRVGKVFTVTQCESLQW